jgi:hypothetical protein
MFIRFRCSNYLSFRETVELILTPGQSTELKHHISLKSKYNGFSVLKTAAIYGGNASGKSNLIKAITFFRNFIVDGPPGLVDFTPHKLSGKTLAHPSEFEAEFRLGDRAYAYGFTLRRRRVHEEWLYEINADTEHELFTRNVGGDGKSTLKLAQRFFKGQTEKYERSETREFFHFIGTGLLPEELFLTACARNNVLSVPHVTETMRFFRDGVTTIFPHTVELSRMPTLHFNSGEGSKLKEMIQRLDTNIADIRSVPVPKPEIAAEVGPGRLSEIVASLQSSEHDFVVLSAVGQYKWFIIDKAHTGKIGYYKLKTVHIAADTGEEVLFDLIEESDGTRRLFDLLSIVLSPASYSGTFVVDELDRSLHPLMVISLIEMFHEAAGDREMQLIFTTHEDTLFDLKYLRRDEFWMMDNVRGASKLTPLSDYRLRSDAVISRGYLYGRYGGVPQIDRRGLGRVAE